MSRATRYPWRRWVMLRQASLSVLMVLLSVISGWVIDGVATMSQPRFEALQFMSRLGFPLFGVVAMTWLARLIAPVRLGPRIEHDRLVVPRHPLLPMMRVVPFQRIAEVRRTAQGFKLVHPGGRKTSVLTSYLENGDELRSVIEGVLSKPRS